MKVKDLRNLLYKLDDTDEVLILNSKAPLNAALSIEQAVIVQTPTEQLNTETGDTDTVFKNKLLLNYSRERSDD